MKLKLFSWKVREANDNNKRKVIKSLIRAQRVDLVCRDYDLGDVH